MAQAHGKFLALVWALVLLIAITAIDNVVAQSSVPDGGCVWTQAKEKEVMDFLRVVYGEAIEGYAVDSVRLVGFEESPPYCRFRLTLRSERSSAVLELKAFWEFGKFVGFTLYSLPAEPVATLDLGNPFKNDTATLSREALRAIDDLVRKVLSAVDVPDLGGRDLNLSKVIRGGELVLSERQFGKQENSPFKDFAESVRLGADVTARVMYRWDEQGHQHIAIEYYRVYDIGLNMTTKYRLLFISFAKLGPGQGWIVYSITFVPLPVKFKRVEVPPEAYIKNAEEAMAEKLNGSCRIMNVSYQRIGYMLPPKEVNGSIYFGKPTYYYSITLDCGRLMWEYTVLINAVNGQAFHISPSGTKSASTDNTGSNPSPQVAYEMGVPIIAAAIAVLAFLIYRGSFFRRH